MDFATAVQANLLSPAVLFFCLGIAATLLRSDLKFPDALYLTLTIYLLTAIGFKGGASLAEAGLRQAWLPGVAAVFLGSVIPLWSYLALRKLGGFSRADAAAISAHYGSVSAVTFVAGTNFLKSVGVPFEAYTSAFLAMMESPAIVVGLLMARLGGRGPEPFSWGVLQPILREALLGRGVVLLAGSLVVGFLSGGRGLETTAGFFVTPFQGVLALFLLEMGMVAARRFADLRRVGLFLLGFGIIMPILHGILGVAVGKLAGLSLGGAVLMGVLSSSASYIAAPAAIRMSLPEANPTFYLTPVLAVTFPFNITLGLPLYYGVAQWIFSL